LLAWQRGTSMPEAKRAASKKAKDAPYTPPPVTDAVLTALFGAEVLGALYSLSSGQIPYGCPLPPLQCAIALVVACVVIFPTISAVKVTSAWVGGGFSRTALAHVGDPLAKKKTMHKFQDQMWQLFIHVTMTAFETYILFYERGGVNWYQDYAAFWTPIPYSQENSPSVHIFYLVQLAIWIDTCFSHRFIEERHKDYVMMYLHHIVTIMLVWGSYSFNYVRVGTVVLFVHDLSDIIVDLLKIFNYLKLEGPKGAFLVELAFLSNLVVWAYLRLYIFPLRIVFRGVWWGGREVVEWHLANGYRHPDHEQVPVERLFVKNGKLGKPSFTVGAGDFDLLEDIRLNPTNDYIKMYWTAGTLLTVLFVMHIIWYFMFWRILYSILFKSNTSSLHEAGEEVYEGDSDEEDKKD